MATCAPAWSQPAGLELVQANAGLVAGIEWRRVMDSPVGEMLRQQMRLAPGPFSGFAAVEKAVLHDVDSVLLATSLNELSKPGAEPPVLLVVTGRFDRAQLREVLKGKRAPEVHHGIELLAPEGTRPRSPRIALVDERTILAGDRALMVGAVDRMQGRALKSGRSKLWTRAAELAARHHIWVVVDAPPADLRNMQGPMAAMASVTGMDLGLSFADGLRMEVNLRAKTGEAAQSLAQMVQGLVAMAALNQDPHQTEFTDVLKKIQVEAQPTGVRLSLALTRAELDKSVQQAARRALATRTASAKTPAVPITPPAPEPPRRSTIRIEGLEGGPVEIPVEKKSK